jgi:hypothetical protein
MNEMEEREAAELILAATRMIASAVENGGNVEPALANEVLGRFRAGVVLGAVLATVGRMMSEKRDGLLVDVQAIAIASAEGLFDGRGD